ncbi:hypothetical protein [Halorussus amylolyticus]|uniref:hypothetical protein n=1 Tax=Halorussus amylolyticus TaxID=1126242 RepID=UPI001053FB7D|nr:hypothetical protein [Halorussus amylolyticus]
MTTSDKPTTPATAAKCGSSGLLRDPDSIIELDPQTRTLLDLKDHISAAEAIDWTLVPGISVAEASVWTRKCDLAREELATTEVGDGE